MVDLLSPKELADAWKVPAAQLYPLLRSGVVPALKIDGRWYIPVNILDKVKSLG